VVPQTEAKDTAGIIAPPPLIYLGALAAGLLLDRRYPLAFLPRGWELPLGALLIALGVLCAVTALLAMRRAGTAVNPYQPTTAIVTNGPYRYTRNPLYLALALFYAGIASFANALWAMALLPVALAVIYYGVIRREEKYLERKFGADYLHYKSAVRRWI
jgi:protein-S-isoprenylcysteine O-methyltransferase Ste14